MKISSNAFKPDSSIPETYTMNGANVSPPLHIEGVPASARSLALEVDDPDAANGIFNHWILFNMDPKITDIRENSAPVWATRGQNDYGDLNYDGPKPPSGTHHYHFKLFALDTMLNLQPGSRRTELDRAMKGHILAQAEVVGTYTRERMR